MGFVWFVDWAWIRLNINRLAYHDTNLFAYPNPRAY